MKILSLDELLPGMLVCRTENVAAIMWYRRTEGKRNPRYAYWNPELVSVYEIVTTMGPYTNDGAVAPFWQVHYRAPGSYSHYYCNITNDGYEYGYHESSYNGFISAEEASDLGLIDIIPSTHQQMSLF